MVSRDSTKLSPVPGVPSHNKELFSLNDSSPKVQKLWFKERRAGQEDGCILYRGLRFLLIVLLIPKGFSSLIDLAHWNSIYFPQGQREEVEGKQLAVRKMMAKLPTSFQLHTLHWQGLGKMARLRLSCRKAFNLKGRCREWLLGKVSNIHHDREIL